MGGTVELPFGLATSVGALPFEAAPSGSVSGSGSSGGTSSESTSSGGTAGASRAAVDMVLELQPAFPTAPTSGGVSGSLLAQAIDGLVGVDALPPGLVRLDDGFDLGAALASEVGVAGPAFEPLRAFVDALASHRRRVGSEFVGVRVGVLGPVTLALALRAAGLDRESSLHIASVLVAERAAAVLTHVRQAVPERVVAVVMSEPGMIGAMHPSFPLAPSEVLALLQPVVASLDAHPLAGELLIGAHVPGRTDWETIICSGVSLISAPADAGLLGWAEALSQFFDHGGRIAWGAVPVDQPLGTGEELLWRRLSMLWCQLVGEGLDPLLLRSRSLTSPVDGLGHFGPTQAGRALALVESLSVRVRHQAIGARMSLGA